MTPGHPPYRRPPPYRWRPAVLLVLAAAGVLAGCERASAPQKYELLSGTVRDCQFDTGEMTIDVPGPGRGEPRLTVLAVITGDSEIYINDKAANLREIAIGDRIEVVGYRDPSPRLGGFVVTLANVDRPQPTPPLPVLSTQPAASQPSEPQPAAAPALGRE